MNTGELIDNVYDALFKNDVHTDASYFIDMFGANDSYVDRENALIKLVDNLGNEYCLTLHRV